MMVMVVLPRGEFHSVSQSVNFGVLRVADWF